jgi:hypothetical protein
MQMQRWFGYRGEYFDLCRVFLSAEQLRLFRSFHDVDEALRRDIISAMNVSPLRAPSVEVLQGSNYLATGKLTSLANWPLCPGARPFVRITNGGNVPDPNLEMLAAEFMKGSSKDVVVSGNYRGRILEEPLSLVDAAALLDRLRYESYRPNAESRVGERWKSLAAHLGMPPPEGLSALTPFYKPPSLTHVDNSGDGSIVCPYSIAAYFRLWEACLSRHARGLFPTDNPDSPWSMVDLELKTRQRPRFYVGIRYGSGHKVSDGGFAQVPFKARASVRAVSNGFLDGTWGTQNPGEKMDGYRGDTFFDYHFHGNPLALSARPGSSWRSPGSPGLLLFYIIERESFPFHTVALGLMIPLGGPDQFAAVTSPAHG